MPLPFLLIPLAVAGGSAIAQAVAKLRSHARLKALHAELEELESRHRGDMRQHYERQIELCRRLDLPEPAQPLVLRETQQAEAAAEPESLWRRLLKRRERTLADGSPHSRAAIVGRHGASFAAGAVWRVWPTTILNVLRPLSTRLLTILPRFAAFGGMESVADYHFECAASPEYQTAYDSPQICRVRRYRRLDSGIHGPAIRSGGLQRRWHHRGAGSGRLVNRPRNQKCEKSAPRTGHHPDATSERTGPLHCPDTSA